MEAGSGKGGGMNLRPIIQKVPDRVQPKLRDSARDCPHCMGCGMENPNRDLLCLAHSNRLSDGKGRGIKAPDITGAILCQRCHTYTDLGDDSSPDRAAMQHYHNQAHTKTLEWWLKVGLITPFQYWEEVKK